MALEWPAGTPMMIALTNPVAGREAEFNQWYDDVHVKDLVAVPGIVAAQRFVLVPSDAMGAQPYQYVAMYQLEGDVESVRAAMASTRSERFVSESLAPDAAMWAFRPIGPTITK
jgi:hypothetical protein